MIQIEINNHVYEIPENLTILQACQRVGIDIPTLCYDERLEPEGNCKLCVVEVTGEKDLVLACKAMIKEGMNILTHSPNVKRARQEVLTKLPLNIPRSVWTALKATL